jgi:ParB family transcriptional regulator, chromosome partitioning protein
MIFGHGRWLAAKAAGIKMLEVKLFPASLSDTQFRLIRAAENVQRKELTGYQKSLLCAELMSGNPTWRMKDLAEQLRLDPSMVTRLLSPSKCVPAWQEALAAGKVGISDCYAASKLGEAEQAELLRLKLSGASRDAIEHAGRKSRNSKSSAIKLSRVKTLTRRRSPASIRNCGTGWRRSSCNLTRWTAPMTKPPSWRRKFLNFRKR